MKLVPFFLSYDSSSEIYPEVVSLGEIPIRNHYNLAFGQFFKYLMMFEQAEGRIFRSQK